MQLSTNQLLLYRMVLKEFTLLSAFIFLFVLTVTAQKILTGTVTDQQTQEVLAGATVMIKGSNNGVLTDENGKFSINANEGQILIISYTTYNPQEVTIGSTNNYDIRLLSELYLKEIVITGYATQRKEDLTGSVSVIRPIELVAIPTRNVANQLQGRAAGVTVTQDGRPGSPSKVRIRGFGSFQANDPLYVVDGVPTQDISTLNPNDIESISILKDAGAASIYGARASNGVIVISTKKGSGPTKIKYDMYIGTQDPGPGPDNLLDTKGYADLQWLVYENDGINEIHPVYGPSPAAGGSEPIFPEWAANTNWWDAATNYAMITSHNLSLSGGGKNNKIFSSLNYFHQDGIVMETFNERFSGRFNSEFNIKDRLTVGENFTITHSNYGQFTNNLSENSPIAEIYRAQSIIPVVITVPLQTPSHNFVPGEWGGSAIAPRLGYSNNVVADQTRDKDDRSFNFRILGSGYADLKIMRGLNFRTTFGGSFGPGYFSDYSFATYELSGSPTRAISSFGEGATYYGEWTWTNTMTFDKDFGAHSILAVTGYEAVKSGIGRYVLGVRNGYFSDAVSFRTLNNGANIVTALSGVNTPVALVSNFLRLDYDFDDKYLLSATIRRDGSSVFGKSVRYGVFPSVTAAWRISQEDYLQANPLISNLKIRGGYGTMGNQLAVNPANGFFLFGGSVNTSFYDLHGTGNSSLQGFRPIQIGNPKAKWETNITTNIGFDAAFFDNRIELVFDWYRKINRDILYNPELPGTAGSADPPFINIAEMKNTGIDLQFIYRDNFGSDFKIETNLTFTSYRNEIVKIADGFDYFDWGGSRIGPFNRNQVGHSMSEFFGYQLMGLFQSEEEVANAPIQSGAAPGFFRYKDIDDNGVIDQEDRTFIGNPNPDFTYGLNLSLMYQNFDFTAFLYGSHGGEIFNYSKWWVDFWPSFDGQKSTDLLLNSWTPSKPDATVPKASNISNFSTNTESTSYYIEDGSFLRLKNLQLGFSFSSSLVEKIGFENARIYVQGTNLFTLTAYSGLDPELGGDDRAYGVDAGNYPVVRQYLLGINLGI